MKKKIHIDNLYLTKKLQPEYSEFFNNVLNIIMENQSLSDADKNIAVNYALEQCFTAMKDGKTLNEAFPNPPSEYATKFSKRSALQSMRKNICKQDYERLVIACIWIVFTVSMVLFFLNNLMNGHYLVNYWVDALIGCIAGAIAFQNYMIKHRVIKRYNFRKIYKYIDVFTLIACVFIKIVSKSNFDITYLLLVIAFFVTKRNIAPEFEMALKK